MTVAAEVRSGAPALRLARHYLFRCKARLAMDLDMRSGMAQDVPHKHASNRSCPGCPDFALARTKTGTVILSHKQSYTQESSPANSLEP